MRANLIVVLGCTLFLMACGGSAPETGTAAAETTREASKKSKTPKGPCELVDEKTLNAVFGSASAAASKESFADSCTYTWPKPNKEEIEAENAKRMKAHITKVMKARLNGEEPPKMEMLSEDNSVTFNYREMADAATAARSLDAMVARMKEGITAEGNGVSATFRINYDREVSGIGQKAVWSTRNKQLVVQYDNLLLYALVDVAVESDANLELAKTLVDKIIAKL